MASKRSRFYNAPFKKPSMHDPQNEIQKIEIGQTENDLLTVSEEVQRKYVTKKLPLKRKNKRTFILKESRKKIKNDTNPRSENTLNATDSELNQLENASTNAKEANQKMHKTTKKKNYANEGNKREINPETTKCNSCSNSPVFVNENDIISIVDALLSKVVKITCENEINQISKEKFKEKVRPALKEILNKPHTHIEHTKNSIKLTVTKDTESKVLQFKHKATGKNIDEIFNKDKIYESNEKHSPSTEPTKQNKNVVHKKPKFPPVLNKKMECNFNCINEENTDCNKEISRLPGNISNDKQDSNETNTLNVVSQSTLLTKELKQDTKDKINEFITADCHSDTMESVVHMTSRPTKKLTIPNMTALDYERENLLKSTFNSKEKSYKDKVSLNQDLLGSGNTNIKHFKDIEPSVNDASKDSFYESFLTLTDLENGIKKKSTNKEKLPAEDSNCSSNILPSKIHILDEKESKKPDSIIPNEKIALENETKVHENQLSSNCTKNIQVTQNSSSIFDKDDFITENIIFRERNENEDDVIPTGIFQHLNEIFHYNKETTLIEAKCEILKHSNETSLDSCLELNNTKENIKESYALEATTEGMEIGHAITLVTASNCIKSINTETTNLKQENYNIQKENNKGMNNNSTIVERISKTTTNLFDSDENGYINKDVAMNKITNNVEENIMLAEDDIVCQYNKEEQADNHIDKNMPMNKVINKEIEENTSSTEDATVSQDKTEEHTDFSDIENCMEMDDDFNLTASQLSMLDADEKIQIQNYKNGRKSVGQQTDIIFGHFGCEHEIITQLNYLKDCIEYIKDRIDK